MVGEKLTLETEVLPHLCLGLESPFVHGWRKLAILEVLAQVESREVRHEVESQSRKGEPGMRREIGACLCEDRDQFSVAGD